MKRVRGVVLGWLSGQLVRPSRLLLASVIAAAPSARGQARTSEPAGVQASALSVPPRVDGSFAILALEYARTGSGHVRDQVLGTAAAHHLAEHARRTAIGTPGPTDSALTMALLDSARAAHLDTSGARQLVQNALGDTASQRRCWNEAADYLPAGALHGSTLYLQVGYDIGVAVSGAASLNVASPHLLRDPQELWFYCVHEMHHAGVEHFHDLPQLSRITTMRQLVEVIRYLTFLEGMAVHAAYRWRASAHALSRDSDYVALGDSARMARDEAEYFRLYDSLATLPAGPLRASSIAVLDRFSAGERLWYRVGAVMADRIERRRGRGALRALVEAGPDRFFAAYDSIR
jgi:hypothetical protein